jgi:hypothetical protein
MLMLHAPWNQDNKDGVKYEILVIKDFIYQGLKIGEHNSFAS